MKALLDQYLKRLTNLSANNRSLLLLKLHSSHFIDLQSFHHVSESPSFEFVSHLMGQHPPKKLLQTVDSRDRDSNRLANLLSQLVRTQKSIYEERGGQDLYVGWPFVTGKFNDDTPVRAPLIFYPVKITCEINGWYIERRTDVNITFNKTFLLAYAFFNKLPIDENLLELTLTDWDGDCIYYRTQLYELLKNSQLDIHFNQDLFLDELQPFPDINKTTFDKQEKTGKLKLYPQAVIGIFPQSGSYLVPDYLHMIEHVDAPDLASFFQSKSLSETQIAKSPLRSVHALETETYTPLPLDAHQEAALVAVKQGRSIVVHGPPGTGKSQLIANMIADQMANGKTVLVVSQKKAALDVVYDRLRLCHLDAFVAQVHDFKSDRRLVYEKIADQIHRVNEYMQINNGLDTIILEREFLQASRLIQQLSESFDEFRNALYDTSECGKSVKELYLIQDPEKPVIDLHLHYRAFHYESLQGLLSQIRSWYHYAGHLEAQSKFWQNGKRFSGFAAGDRIKIQDAVKDAIATFESFDTLSKEKLANQPDFDTCSFFIQKRQLLEQFIQTIDHEVTHQVFLSLLQKEPDENIDWLIDKERLMLNCFKGAGLEQSLPTTDLGRFQLALEHAFQARRSPISWLRWKLFSKDRLFISRVLVANQLKSTQDGFETLIARIDNRLNYEHLVSQLEDKAWLAAFPHGYEKTAIQNWFFYQRTGIIAFDLFKQLKILDSYVYVSQPNRKIFVSQVKDLAELLDLLMSHLSRWANYLSDSQLRELLSKRANPKDVVKELDREFENLVAFHTLDDQLSPAVRYVLSQLAESQIESANEKLACVENSVALAWIQHIEAKYPVLRKVSTLTFDEEVQMLRMAVGQKQALSRDITLLKCREKTYQKLDYNRQQNLVTYRELDHQVQKKKRIWPLRKLIAQHTDEIFQLIPCWMTSPEAGSAIFPMDTLFDLVIFDEASQCFVERCIPSIYRAKQFVVAGDHQQLQPYDLYQVRWENEEETDSPETEIDALLDVARLYLPSYMLEGHYRSKSLELIAFSNFHFYDGKLQVLPHKSVYEQKDAAIQYHHCNGTWENQHNEKEAHRVIDLILHLKQTGKSIGVVTFNAPQQILIQQTLDYILPNWEESGQIFVKNIENVQGDERDIIIFSTAYARDAKGQLQFRFGSLSQKGGENRLNVAITRAKVSIHLVTSLLPEDLQHLTSTHRGPQLLKEYLAYAYAVSSAQKHVIEEKQINMPKDWYLSKHIQVPDELKDKIVLQQDLPFADLTVKVDNQPISLLLTDDHSFYRSKSAKDAHVYHFERVKDADWPVFQIYSRQYWQDEPGMSDQLRIFFTKHLPKITS